MKKSIFLSLLIIILLLVAACRGSDEETTPEPPTAASETAATEPVVDEAPAVEDVSSEPVIVRFAVADLEQGRYADLIDAFEEENPDVQVKLVSLEEILELDSLAASWPDDALRRLVSAADVSSYFYATEAAYQGLLLDLTPFIETEPDFDPDDFHPGMLEGYQYSGGTWAVPTGANYHLIFYHKDAFDAAGVDYPQAGWSWDDFLVAAQATTQGDGDELTWWGFVEVSPSPRLFIEGRDVTLFDMDSDPPGIYLDDPQVADRMRWYSDLYLDHEVAPYFPQPEGEGVLGIPKGYALIEGGQAAMWPDVSGSWPYRSQQMNIGVVPFPVDSADSASSPVYPSGLSVSAGTANPEAAWRWVDFLTRQASELDFFGSPGSVPARVSATEASGFWDDVDEELGSALRYAMTHTYVPAAPPGGYGALFDAFEAIVNDGKVVEDALADAQIEVEDAVEESLAADTGEVQMTEAQAETEASEDAVTIDFIVGAGVFEMQAFRDLARSFSEENPDIVVEIKAPDFFDGTPELADIADASDCFQWYPGGFNDPKTTGAILSVDPFLDADPNIEAADFYPVILDAFTSQGQTWGLPALATITLIQYNKDLFDAAGLAYPSPDWNTEAFLEAAVALTQGEGDARQYGYVSDLFEPSDMISFMDRLGVNIIDEDADPPALAFDDPSVIEAVRWFTGLTTEYEIKPVLMTSLTDIAVAAVQERQALLDQGRAGMWTNSAVSGVLGDDPTAAYNTGAVSLPSGLGDARGSGLQNASGYFISSGTKARQACWNWITYLTEQPNLGPGLPGRQAVAESEAYRQYIGSELAEAFLASIGSANRPPFAQQISGDNSWMNLPIIWLYGAYSQVVKDGLPVEEALGNAQQMADDYRACVIANEALNDGDGQRACMLEIDDTIPPYLIGG